MMVPVVVAAVVAAVVAVVVVCWQLRVWRRLLRLWPCDDVAAKVSPSVTHLYAS